MKNYLFPPLPELFQAYNLLTAQKVVFTKPFVIYKCANAYGICQLAVQFFTIDASSENK